MSQGQVPAPKRPDCQAKELVSNQTELGASMGL